MEKAQVPEVSQGSTAQWLKQNADAIAACNQLAAIAWAIL